MKLKTLKDWEKSFNSAQLNLLKELAIKWVKEDKKVLEIITPIQYKLFDGFLKLWMKRLNITEENLNE